MRGVHIDKCVISTVPCIAMIHVSGRHLICHFQLFHHVATLESESTVSVGCGNAQNFICMAPGVPIGWNIAGLSGINLPGPFLARNASIGNSRITSTDNGAFLQIGVSDIIISEFIISDNGGIIQCVNMNNNSTIGMATISVGELVSQLWCI